MQYINLDSPQIINQGYKIWKKNVPALYNILQTYQLESCSQTIDWFSESYVDSAWRCMNLLIGTNSIANNAVYRMNVYLPTDESTVDAEGYSQVKPQDKPGANNYVGTMGQQNFQVRTTMHQDAEVMKVRISKADQNKENLVAVKVGGSNPELILYNLNHQELELQSNKIILLGHDTEGYGLSWNNQQSNILASCSYDKKILVWDVNKNSKQISPLKQIKSNQILQQIKWMHGSSNIFCVGSQNKQISLYDIRQASSKPSLSKTAHNGQIYALDFNRFSQNLLLSGGQQNDIYLWDIRNMTKKYNSFIGHNDYVTSIQWSNHRQTTFISGSADRKIVVWDINQIQSQMTSQQKQKQNKSNEIKFIHNGHRSNITDLCFSQEHNLIGSCEENNVMQVWQMNDGFLKVK